MKILIAIVAIVCFGLFVWRTIRFFQRKNDAEKEYDRNSWRDEDKAKKPVVKMEIWSWLFLAVTVVCLILEMSMVIIQPAHVGIKVRNGVEQGTLGKGINFIVPLIDSVEVVDNRYQTTTIEEKLWSETSQQTPVFYENIKVTYYIPAESSEWVYFNVPNYESQLIEGNIVATAVKSSSVKFVDTEATNRGKIEPEAQTQLQTLMDQKYGERRAVIVAVNIGNADFEDEYNQAIAAKSKAAKELETADLVNQKKIKDAEANKQEAEIKAEQEYITKVKAAQAEKDANELLQKSLTPEIIQMRYLEKWDGRRPLYESGTDGNIIVDFGSVTADE